MISRHLGKTISFSENNFIKMNHKINFTIGELLKISKYIGLDMNAVRISYRYLKNQVNLPCIVHWNKKHFIVIYNFYKKNILVADPAIGFIEYKKNEFLRGWLERHKKEGIALILNKQVIK
jgi:ATP-binding cassette subfamily B protein